MTQKRGLWKLTRYGNRGKTNCVFPPFPQRLENSTKNVEFPTVPTAPATGQMNNKTTEQKDNNRSFDEERRQVHVYAIYLHSHTLWNQQLLPISQNPRLQRGLCTNAV